jgi:hypothetical protein
MIFQLPNGKIMHLSVEEYLHLTDEDIQYLISTGYGVEPSNPFYSSSLSKPSSEKEPKQDIDYQPESDEATVTVFISIDKLTDEELDSL